MKVCAPNVYIIWFIRPIMNGPRFKDVGSFVSVSNIFVPP